MQDQEEYPARPDPFQPFFLRLQVWVWPLLSSFAESFSRVTHDYFVFFTEKTERFFFFED